MKILQVIPNLKTGGAQRLLSDIVLNLKDDNEIRIVVFNLTDSGLEKVLTGNGIEIISLNVTNRSPLAIFKLRKFIKWADVLHLHLFPTLYYASLSNIGINRPIIYTEHSTHNRRRNYRFLKKPEIFFYGKTDKIVSISQQVQNELKKWLTPQKNILNFTVIENGINPDAISSAPSISSLELFGREGKALLMISRFSSAKDHLTLIKAMQYIADPKIFLVLAGEGETEEDARKLVKKLQLEDKIIFLGNRNEIGSLIKASYIGIQSSNWEGFGLSALEMMAGGIPVIGSDIEGLRDTIRDAGLLFEKGNERDLAEKINLLLENKKLYDNLLNKAKERATFYSIKKTAEKYQRLYNQLYKRDS